MRSASSSLIDALAARAPMWSADLFTLALPSGPTYYWTSADRDITLSGQPFSAAGPTIDRSAWSGKNTTEIPEMTMQIYSNGSDFASGRNIKLDAHNGLFDGAYILLQRVFMPAFGDVSLGAVTLFGGRFGAIEINALGIKVTCTASSVMLTQELPRRTYQATCRYTLFDVSCTLDPAAFTDSYTVETATPLTLGWVTGTGPADPVKYLYGTMTVTSGAGAGQQLTVSGYLPAGVGWSYPLLIVPVPGDTFTVQQGCSKSVVRCTELGNIVNFGGMPYIPQVSTGI